LDAESKSFEQVIYYMAKAMKTIQRVLTVILATVVIATVLVAQGENNLPNNLRNNREVRSAFQSATSAADAATVRIQCAGKDAALGTVVGSDGWILTKFSELREPITCKLHDGKQLSARVVGQDQQYDLAMLKIDATGLKTIDWTGDEKGPAVGQFLATASPGELPLAIGVVSTPRRAIPRRPGRLGIQFGDSKEPVIETVYPGSPAKEAGLKIDDKILEINDKAVVTRRQFLETITQMRPGDEVHLVVKRGDDELKISATLKRAEEAGMANRSERMNEMGGPLSHRSYDFPSVIQHDTVLQPNQCGGPLVDLSGKAVGINIARAGRTESYAAPADKVLGLITDLESGRMAPKDALPGAKEVKTSATQSAN
jgi:serine protease Do